MQKLTMAAALTAGVLGFAPASAASFIVTPGSPPAAISSGNDFSSELASLGYTLQSIAASISLSGPARVTFEFLGSESGFKDSFSFAGLPGFGETSLLENHFAAPVTLGGANFGAGLLDLLFSSTGSGSRNAANGDPGFAVFLPELGPNSLLSDVVYFGFDDKMGFDDDFDDFLIRARIAITPEPGTWATMIAGFGLVGAALRRKRSSPASVRT